MNDRTSTFDDRVILPSDARYDEARRLWNGLLEPRPALIVRCLNAEDVSRALGIARDRKLTVSVRGGGHGVAGRACRDESLVIDLREMRDVIVDPARRVARAEGGATWADLDQATSAHGLATTGGLISSTGIGGLTLGGGIGWLVRSHGLSCDNLVAAEIVTADGEVRTVSEQSEEELFWALRGAGFGLGVVTALEYQLHPVAHVLAGMVMHPAARAGNALKFFRNFCASAPDELTSVLAFTFAPPAPFVPEELRGKPAVAIAACWSGEPSEGERVLAPLRSFGPPPVDIIAPMRYVDAQTMLDPTAPSHQLNYWKSAFVPGLTDEVVSRLAARGTSLPSPLAQIHVHHLGGAMARVTPGSTAFDQRRSEFLINIPTMWTDPAKSSEMIAWTRASHAELVEDSNRGSYVNFHDRDDRNSDAWSSSTGRRLQLVKDAFDPERLFGPDPIG